MEYDNDYKSKYNTPAYYHYTRMKKDEKNKKRHGRESPQGEW